jgi:hypothetical protein
MRNCGWEPGQVPVALTETPNGHMTTFVAEKCHKFILIFGVLACAFGVIALASAASGRSAGSVVAGIIFGSPVLAAGVVSSRPRAVAKPGGAVGQGESPSHTRPVCGAFLELVIIPVTLGFFAAMAMLPKSGL